MHSNQTSDIETIFNGTYWNNDAECSVCYLVSAY